MVTAKMWKCIENILKACPPKIIEYNTRTKYLKLNRYWWIWFLGYVLALGPIVVSFLGALLLDLFIDNTLPTNIKYLIVIVLLLAFCTGGLALVFIHSLLLNDQYVIILFNLVSKFEPSFGTSHSTKLNISIIDSTKYVICALYVLADFLENIGDHRVTRRVETFLLLVPLTLAFVDVLLAAFLVYFNLDPIYGFLKWGLQFKLDNVGATFLVFPIRMFPLIVLMYFAAIVIITVVIIFLCFFHFIYCVLDYLNQIVWEQLKSYGILHCHGMKRVLSIVRKPGLRKSDVATIRSSTALNRCVTFHRQFRIVEIIANKAVCFIGPFLIGFGIILIVSMNHGSIRMYGVIPLIFYLPLPFYSVLATAFAFFLFPTVSNIHDLSTRFLSRSKLVLATNKWLSRRLRSERSLRINIGSFFKAKKSTESATFLFILETTANSLILTK